MKTVNMASLSSFYHTLCDMAFGFYSLHQSWFVLDMLLLINFS